jgi:hypothetical protein
MPVPISIKRSHDGDVYCKPDPAELSLSGNPDRMFRWHCNFGEFTLKFYEPSPFEDGSLEKHSTDSPPPRQVEGVARNDVGQFVYSVEVHGNSGQEALKADPGLIIKP